MKNSIRLFADDTKIYRTVTTDSDCLSLQKDIDSIEEWASKWQLKFHPKKCKTMRIGDKYPKYNYTMTAEDGTIVQLEETVMEKDLGVVDNKLTFSQHINSTVVKANQIVGMIRCSFKYMDKEICVQLFTSRVRPILEYGNVIWNPRLIRNIDAIERVQRRKKKVWFYIALYPVRWTAQSALGQFQRYSRYIFSVFLLSSGHNKISCCSI